MSAHTHGSPYPTSTPRVLLYLTWLLILGVNLPNYVNASSSVPSTWEAYTAPNVTSTYGEINRVVPEGVQLKTGALVPLDVLIFGTGFSVVRR